MSQAVGGMGMTRQTWRALAATSSTSPSAAARAFQHLSSELKATYATPDNAPVSVRHAFIRPNQIRRAHPLRDFNSGPARSVASTDAGCYITRLMRALAEQ